MTTEQESTLFGYSFLSTSTNTYEIVSLMNIVVMVGREWGGRERNRGERESRHALITILLSKTRSVSKDWAFISKGTEVSLGKFVLDHFTPLTLDIQTGEEWSLL